MMVKPKVWRLIDVEDRMEMVFCVVGVVCGTRLPPYIGKASYVLSSNYVVG